jgi:hypothetical protein
MGMGRVEDLGCNAMPIATRPKQPSDSVANQARKGTLEKIIGVLP